MSLLAIYINEYEQYMKHTSDLLATFPALVFINIFLPFLLYFIKKFIHRVQYVPEPKRQRERTEPFRHDPTKLHESHRAYEMRTVLPKDREKMSRAYVHNIIYYSIWDTYYSRDSPDEL